MKTLTLSVPEETNEIEVKKAVAAMLFSRGLLSSGQAAEYSGITKREFLETVGKYGVSVFGEIPEDLQKSFDK